MYEVTRVQWTPDRETDIKEIYRMFKDQERKIFDLTAIDTSNVMDIVEYAIMEDTVFIVKADDIACACFIVENPAMYQGRLIKANLHCVIRKAFWGKESRNICKAFLDFMDKYFAPLKLTAFVPQCGYGIIKLLKDMGFVHEGTMKKSRLYLDKNNQPKLYDELIYSRNRMD